jgi:hypothetical protein
MPGDQLVYICIEAAHIGTHIQSHMELRQGLYSHSHRLQGPQIKQALY